MSVDEWKNDFKGYINALDMPKDDYKGIMEYIDELPYAQQWIPCTPETMPKMSAMTETYLVKVGINECGEGMHTEVRTADWYSSSKMWNVHESEKSIVGEVTAWMPAPNM